MSFFKKISNKINFELGQNPRIERTTDYKKYIPDGFSSVLLIYADFELAWAWRFSRKLVEPVLDLAFRERNNVPDILNLCKLYNIPITWATVGHLFLESCGCDNKYAHPDMPRPANFENEYWDFKEGDWYKHDPCGNINKNPEWYCPDLIDMILSSENNHEIACHTFSHIDCREKFCTHELISREIEKCIELAKKYNIELKSFVHPAHTVGNMEALLKYKFSSYRTDNGNILGYPHKGKYDLWQIKSTWEFAYFSHWDVDYHVYRYCEIINRAINNNSVCVFWFHPSIKSIFIKEIMPQIFKHADSLRNELFISTVREYLKEIDGE